jgi:purine-binding chemotaxis protein CheW
MSPSGTQSAAKGGDHAPASREFVTVSIAKQCCGIPVLKVQDVLGAQRIARIPLAPPEVAGALNLRGRIVTAVDLRVRLGLPPRSAEQSYMSVVVERNDELYSLMVDTVGEVLRVPPDAFERNPPTLDPLWREFSEGVYRLESGLLIVLDVETLLEFAGKKEAA